MSDEDILPFNDEIVKLECNIDDLSGELMGALLEQLFTKVKVRDAFYQSIFMKKNRPAYLLTVLCTKEQVADAARIVLTESTAIGLRYSVMKRLICERSTGQFESSLGTVQVKHCTLPKCLGSESITYPEYEDLKRLSEEIGVSLKKVEGIVRGELYAQQIKSS